MRSVSFKTAVMLEIKKKFIWALDEANKISQKVFDEVCNEQKQSQSKQMGNIISKCAGIYNDYVELLINNVFNEWKDSKANSIELIIRFDKENEEAISKENKNIDDIAVSVIEAFSCVNVSLKSSEFPTISSDYYNNCSSYFQKARQQFKELHSSLLTHFQTEAEENLVYYFYGALICCIISQFIAFYDNAVSQFKLIANDVNYQLNSVRADSELIYMQNIIKTANSKIKKAYGLQNEARIAFGSSYNNNQNLNENSNSNEKENSAIFRRFLNSNIRSFNLPKRGKWSGTPGNSEFLISDNADVKCNKGQNQCTGRKLKEWMHCNYGTEIIKYNNYDPDFSPFMDKIIGEIDISDCPDDMSLRKFAFNKVALIMKEKGLNLKEYLKKHELTIHETGNYKAIAIPKVINSVFNHTGGDAIHDYRSRIRSYIRQRFDGKKIRFYKCQNLKTSVSIFGDLKKFELRKIIKNTDTK